MIDPMPSTVSNLPKMVGINLLVLFVAGNVFYWSIPAIHAISEAWKVRPATAVAAASDAPADATAISRSFSAEDNVWMPAYAREIRQQRSQYVSYVGWRSEALDGKALTIGGPYNQRLTVNTGARGDKKAYFFGGSTMWGAFSDNAGTIPSQFAAITGIHSENFGELGWTAHQSLIMLIQLLQEGHRPDLVIFYDGINDTSYNCRGAHRVGAHSFEKILNERLRRDPRIPIRLLIMPRPSLRSQPRSNRSCQNCFPAWPRKAARRE